jgi:hypothetical protein
LEPFLIGELQREIEKEMRQFTATNIPAGDLELHQSLGFGTVFKATRLSSAEVLAVKEV